MIASIQKILKVDNVINSDNLDKVMVLGWQVVTKRGEYRVNDLCIYVELDSILPDGPEWSEFMRNKSFRVKSIKLRKELSQGLILPLTILPKEHSDYYLSHSGIEGIDVSELLGIIHYEKPVPANLKGQIRGNFPPYVSKTDETRVQSVPGIIDELKGKTVYATVKCDGTSATYLIKDGDFHVCSRNNSIKISEENDNNLYIQMMKKYDIENKLRNYGKNIAFQGEICGPSVQKNRLGLKEHELFMFNLYFIDERRYAGVSEFFDICAELGFNHVPWIKTWTFDNTIEELIEMADGFYEGTKNLREGIVIRTITEEYSNVLKGRVSFKVLNNKFLLKEGE